MVIIVLHWRLQETMRSCRVPDELVAEVAQFLAEMMISEDEEVDGDPEVSLEDDSDDGSGGFNLDSVKFGENSYFYSIL